MEGILKNEICNRDGCKGIIQEKDTDGGCSCHINPPCSYCETPREYCSECDWDAKEEYDNYERERLKSVREYHKRPEVVAEREKQEAEEKLFYEMYRGEKPVTEYISRHRSHTHFSQIIFGVHPDMSQDEIRKKVNGTFGGRFSKFNNYSFEFVAYTD